MMVNKYQAEAVNLEHAVGTIKDLEKFLDIENSKSKQDIFNNMKMIDTNHLRLLVALMLQERVQVHGQVMSRLTQKAALDAGYSNMLKVSALDDIILNVFDQIHDQSFNPNFIQEQVFNKNFRKIAVLSSGAMGLLFSGLAIETLNNSSNLLNRQLLLEMFVALACLIIFVRNLSKDRSNIINQRKLLHILNTQVPENIRASLNLARIIAFLSLALSNEEMIDKNSEQKILAQITLVKKMLFKVLENQPNVIEPEEYLGELIVSPETINRTKEVEMPFLV